MMSETNNPILSLGTLGWDQGFEATGFYPEDLPEDWRLTYLSNELDRVAIPLSLLDELEADDIEEWAEDTHEQFRFYLSVPPDITAGAQAAALARLSPLQEQLLGVIALQPLTVDEVLAEEVSSLQKDGAIALVETVDELSPMGMRRLIERLRAEQIDTLLFAPGPGLIVNLENAETISSLLG